MQRRPQSHNSSPHKCCRHRPRSGRRPRRYHRPTRPRRQWPQPPPPLVRGGGSHRWGPQPVTRRTQRGDSMMRPGPRITPAADAKATTGACSRAPHDRQECHHNPNPNHSPNPNPSSSANAPGELGATGDDLGTNNGIAIQLRCLATSPDALTAGDVATEPGALVVRAWAEGTRRNWRRDLQIWQNITHVGGPRRPLGTGQAPHHACSARATVCYSALCWRFSEAVSVRPADLATP